MHESIAYDDIGNIVNKSDLADQSGGTGTYTYGTGHQPPHAVRSISGTVNGVKDPSFKYDADGNLTCEYTGANCGGGAITKETDAYCRSTLTVRSVYLRVGIQWDYVLLCSSPVPHAFALVISRICRNAAVLGRNGDLDMVGVWFDFAVPIPTPTSIR